MTFEAVIHSGANPSKSHSLANQQEFREMTATRRVGVSRTGYVLVVLGCPGVRRGVWIRLLLSVKYLAMRCT